MLTSTAHSTSTSVEVARAGEEEEERSRALKAPPEQYSRKMTSTSDLNRASTCRRCSLHVLLLAFVPIAIGRPAAPATATITCDIFLRMAQQHDATLY